MNKNEEKKKMRLCLYEDAQELAFPDMKMELAGFDTPAWFIL